MSGNILQAAIQDAKKFTTSGGFETDIIIENPPGSIQANLKGLAAKHHISFDTEGNPINSKNVHISIDENQLVASNYPVRVNNEISLLGHKITYADSTGNTRQYLIEQTLPDEVLGLIVCILGDYTS